MNELKKELVKELLNSTGKPGPEMTHNVSLLGDGNMADGFVALYRSGQMNGIVIGAGVVTALVATYKVGKAVVEGIKAKHRLRYSCNIPLESKRCDALDSEDTVEAETVI